MFKVFHFNIHLISAGGVMNAKQEFDSITFVCVCEGPLGGNRKLETVVNKPHFY